MRCRTRPRIHFAGRWESSGRRFPGCLKPRSCFNGTRQVRRGCDHRGPSGVQRRAGILSGRPCPGNSCRPEVAAGDHGVGPADGVWKNLPAADLVPGDIVKLSLGGVVAADVRLVEGSVLLDQSMLTGESMPSKPARTSRPMPGLGPARRGGRGGYGDRNTHEVWSHRGACAHGACRQLAAKGGAARRAQSRDVQRRPHYRLGGLCVAPRHAACRDHSPRAHGGSGIDPGRAAGDFYPCCGGWRTVSGTPGRSADAALRRGRSGIHRCPVRGQDGHADAQ